MTRGLILDRALDPLWLDIALSIAQSDQADSRERLEAALRDRIPFPTARNKTTRILARVWLKPPLVAVPVIRWGLAHAQGVADTRALHVGAMLATFPFFGDLCASTGRELALHGETRLGTLRQSLRRQWGDREVIDVSARAGLRTLRAFGFLHSESGARIAQKGERLGVSEPVASWICHALMVERGVYELDAREIGAAPELFMLNLPRTLGRSYPNLERLSEGGGRTVIRLSDARPALAAPETRSETGTEATSAAARVLARARSRRRLPAGQLPLPDGSQTSDE